MYVKWKECVFGENSILKLHVAAVAVVIIQLVIQKYFFVENLCVGANIAPKGSFSMCVFEIGSY